MVGPELASLDPTRPPLPLSLYLSLSLMLFFSFSSFTLFPYHQASPSSCHPAPPVVRLRRPWFPLSLPSLRSGTRGTNPPEHARPHRQPAPDCRTAPRAHSVQECSNVHGTLPCVCVCVLACLLACRLDSSTIVHRTAHPEVAPRCRTGRGGRAAFLSQVASLPPTTHHPHHAPPTSWEVFFWKVWRWLRSALTHLRHR